jgi:DNA-binding SARP family transcriptional activator
MTPVRSAGGTRVRDLGPLEVRDDGWAAGDPAAQAAADPRVLLLRAGEVVSKEALIDALWGDDPVVTADKTLQMHVSHLRRAFGPEGRNMIATREGGYRIDPERLDLAEFERALTAAGSAASAQQAADGLRDALALWRGPPLSDLEAARDLQPLSNPLLVQVLCKVDVSRLQVRDRCTA